MVLRWLGAAGVVCVVAACGPSTADPADRSTGGAVPSTARANGTPTTGKPSAIPATGGAGYSAALSARLVTTDALPPGFTVEIATVMAPDAGRQRPGPEMPCTDMIPLLSANRLTGTPSAMAAATVSSAEGLDYSWVASEVLRTYADDSAREAMADLRTLIGRCPAVASPNQDGGSYRFAVVPGPRLGDESMRVDSSTTSGSITLEWDSSLVRIGTTLVVVHEQGNEPGGDAHLTRLAEAALRSYQTTGP
ncbi:MULTISPECIES: hypothetical protein [unclassified Micromonospora]|uniref:hypothetical protein n=1 Tax=unclassified Micromonospora TaxID=2617518 RepID=UPI0022B6C208|nr:MULTISPECIES: hypothetical protein [unclassified Micromonospora]MCZ7473097.1 hypothetical protein [Micromonospora sp. WMMC273]WBC03774.1 hypothetical protein O7546_01995 [Micromonospora sp. WMMA1976]